MRIEMNNRNRLPGLIGCIAAYIRRRRDRRWLKRLDAYIGANNVKPLRID